MTHFNSMTHFSLCNAKSVVLNRVGKIKKKQEKVGNDIMSVYHILL